MTRGFLISVAPGDGLPIYRQIVEQVKALVATGVLQPDERLPSHRDLAAELVVAPLTVKRAYDVLEQEGLVVTKRGLGTFVVGDATAAGAEADEELQARVRALVRQARVLGLDEQELVAAVIAGWRAAHKGRATTR